MNKFTCAALALCLGGVASTALAQPAASESFTESHEDKPDEMLGWRASAGAVWASGNTNAWTLNAGTAFGIVRGRHGFGFDWTFAYGRADPDPSDDTEEMVDAVRSSLARARYDFYLTRMDALFLSVVHRWDTFAGLDTRLQLQAGYLRNFFLEEKHRFWGEVGYDFTYDDYTPTQDPSNAMVPACDPAMGAPADVADRPSVCLLEGERVHAARAYLGYDNQLNELVLLTTGLEALFNLTDANDIRLNFDVAITSTLTTMLKLELKFRLLFDNEPVPGKESYDSLLTASLVFSLGDAVE